MMHYDDMARRHQHVTFHDRRAFHTVHVRHMNNFVKSCFIDAAVRTVFARDDKNHIDVADIAGGRGQDQSKWMYAARSAGNGRIGTYYGLDLSPADTEFAVNMSEKWFPKAKRLFICGDMTRGFPDLPDASVDVVSCQLALHYVCDSPDRVSALLSEMRRVLRPAGLVLLSFTDGRSVVRRARDLLRRDTKPDDVLVGSNQYCTFRIAAKCVGRSVPSPWNLPYSFCMRDSVENVDEFLCHEGAIVALAARVGLRLGVSRAFDEAAVTFARVPKYAEIGDKMDGTGTQDPHALDTAALYRMCVLSPNADVLNMYAKCLHQP